MWNVIPFDAISVAVIILAALALIDAWLLRGPTGLRVGLVLFAALIIRIDASYQRSLHAWDERYHALVAKHLVDDPLRPTLYQTPALPYDITDWTANHVWLHKPPGALWLMAASMRLFGINELTMRAPSVLLSTLAVFLTFLIGRALFDSRVALLAAGFHAVNGFLVGLAAGRRVADHVDTALIVAVELGVWAIVTYASSGRVRWLIGTGVALGAAFLIKSWPALVILPVAIVTLLVFRGVRAAVYGAAAVLAIGAIVAAPWTLFAHLRYPAEAASSARYALLHITTLVEGQGTSRWTYFRDAPHFFGELIALPVGAAVLAVARYRPPPGLIVVLCWACVPYLVFSMTTTRLPGYVMTAAPALFLIQAWLWVWFRHLLPRLGSRPKRIALATLLVLLAVLPGRYLLEPRGAFERRDRWPLHTQRLAALRGRLGLEHAVLFNVRDPIETMFYSPYTAYSRMPTTEEVELLRSRGEAVFIYQSPGETVQVPHEWPVGVLAEQAAIGAGKR